MQIEQPLKYFEEAKQIWRDCVPKSGQSSTVEGELLRAVEKLRDEAIRNGNINWDQGFEVLLDYLFDHLLRLDVYSSNEVARTREVLNRLKDFEYPICDDEVYDYLGDQVVIYFQHFGSQSHAPNPSLYR